MAKKKSKFAMSRALQVMTAAIAANAAHEGISFLNDMDFMKGEAGKVNYPKLGITGALTVAPAAGAAFIDNDYVTAAMSGIASGSSIHMKDEVKTLLAKPAETGDAEQYTRLYNSMGNTEKINLGETDAKTIKIG